MCLFGSEVQYSVRLIKFKKIKYNTGVSLEVAQMPERRALLSSLSSEKQIQPGQHHRSGPNGTFKLGPGTGWIFEIREAGQRTARFSIKRDVTLGEDPVILSDVGHGEYRQHVHLGDEGSHYISDPRFAPDGFTVDIYDAG